MDPLLLVNQCSGLKDRKNSVDELHADCNVYFVDYYTYFILAIITSFLQVYALLERSEMQQSGKHKGYVALYNCLVQEHAKFKGVQHVYCNPFQQSRSMAVTAWALS
jgi:hypothetical protein